MKNIDNVIKSNRVWYKLIPPTELFNVCARIYPKMVNFVGPLPKMIAESGSGKLGKSYIRRC